MRPLFVATFVLFGNLSCYCQSLFGSAVTVVDNPATTFLASLGEPLVGSIGGDNSSIRQGFYNFSPGLTTAVENEHRNSFTAFPNPTQGVLTLVSKELIETVVIINSQGMKVFESSGYIDLIDLEHLPAGIYFLRVRINNQQQNLKIIKQ